MAGFKYVPGQLGLFRPESDWQPPAELPDLRRRPLVAIDTETKDLGLLTGKGPGWPFGADGGYITGVSYAAEGVSGYVPLRHPDSPAFARDQVARWLADLFASPARIVMHNSPYDVGWVGTDLGVTPPAHLEDTLAAAVMDNETHREYSLDACCARAGVPGKDLELLREAVRAYGGDQRRPGAYLWMLPARYVGPYAEQDAVSTLAYWQRVEPLLHKQGVWDAYRTEIELVPMVVAMRRRGIRIDMDRAHRARARFLELRDAILTQLGSDLGIRRPLTIEEARSPRWLERAFAGHAPRIQVPRTSGGSRGEAGARGSFSADWMAGHEHWLPRQLAEVTKYEDAAHKFIDAYLLEFVHCGRLHAEVHQFKSDEGGTRSHRFSYSEPPLQQWPSPDKDPRDEDKHIILDRAIGLPIRQCCLPEEGSAWLSPDYSQQEPRITVHFASVCGARGAEAAVQRYSDNPRTDYHQMVADMTGMPRPRAKILNLAMTYGKGKYSTAQELGVSIEEAEEILSDYHHRLPYIRSLESTAQRLANNRGYIRLIDGARMHYDDWDIGWVDPKDRGRAAALRLPMNPCSLEEARERQRNPEHPWHGRRLVRADARKALNNLIQGSAARQTKLAMLAMWREGFLPMLQMHDEVPTSVSSGAEVERIGEIMRSAVPLRVPVVVDLEVGPNWGEAKMSWEDYTKKYGQAE